MDERWRPGEVRFLGLPRKKARIVAALLVAIVVVAGILMVILREAFWPGIGIVAFALVMGLLLGPFMLGVWATPLLWSLPELHDSLRRNRRRER